MKRSYALALKAAMALPALIEQDRIRRNRERRDSQMFEPGGFKCNAWPSPLVRPFEAVRWTSDTRQQRRARERASRKGNR
jgi:hypothetical protein